MNDLVRLDHVFEEKKFTRKSAAASVGAALLLVGLGWGAGAKIDAMRGPSPEQLAAQAAAKSAEKVAQAEKSHQRAIADLRAHVDGLKSKLDAEAEKVRGSEAAVAALQKSLAEEKVQSQALHARLEKLQAAAQPAKQPEPPTPPARPVDRTPTATIAPHAKVVAAKPPAAPAPKRYGAYILRDVNDGLAIIEGAYGEQEVGPGDVLRGGVRVQGLEKRGGAWVVMTDRGYIAPEGAWD